MCLSVLDILIDIQIKGLEYICEIWAFCVRVHVYVCVQRRGRFRIPQTQRKTPICTKKNGVGKSHVFRSLPFQFYEQHYNCSNSVAAYLYVWQVAPGLQEGTYLIAAEPWYKQGLMIDDFAFHGYHFDYISS